MIDVAEESPNKRLKTVASCNAATSTPSDGIDIGKGDAHAVQVNTPSTTESRMSSSYDDDYDPRHSHGSHSACSTNTNGEGIGASAAGGTATAAATAAATATATNSSAEGEEPQKKKHPRKFVSVFSSNQAIHKLTDRIVESCQQQEEREREQEQSRPQTSRNSSGSVSVSQQQGAAFNQNDKPVSDDDNDGSEIEVTDSNVTNPFIAYPHPRNLCGVYPFIPNANATTTATATANSNSNANHSSGNELFCDNCYCKVCDKPAVECHEWKHHCHACDTPEWQQKKMDAKRQVLAASASASNGNGNGNVICLDDSSDDEMPQAQLQPPQHQNQFHFGSGRPQVQLQPPQHQYQSGNAEEAAAAIREIQSVLHPQRDEQASHSNHIEEEDDDDDRGMNGMHNMNAYDHHFDKSAFVDPDLIGQKSRKDARIVEVLAHNLRQLSNLSIANSSTANRSVGVTENHDGGRKDNGEAPKSMPPLTAEQVNKMEGDVPQLNLHKSFFVEGVRIGWPYPMIMPPQRQMAIHLTKAFKNKRHVVIESPTGTG
jgi:hypothetical protein